MDDLKGQLTLADWFLSNTVPDYPVEIARHIIFHCCYWPAYSSRLPDFEADPTYNNFLRLFCDVSKSMYFGHDEGSRTRDNPYPHIFKVVPLYEARFDRDGFCYVKRTGKDFDSRDYDAVLPVGQILDSLLLEIQLQK